MCSCTTNNNYVFNASEQASLIEAYEFKPVQADEHNKIVLVGGCFDVLHYGHIEFLKNAKAAGNYLIVALEPDEKIIKYKHRKPIHTQQQRAEILSAICFVNKVLLLPVLNGFEDYNQLVEHIRPSIIAVTAGDPQVANKEKQAKSIGATVKAVVKKLEGFSSSLIISGAKNKNDFAA